MLTPIDEVSTASADAVPASAKQICAEATTQGAVVYTVPPGKQFRGWASHERSTQGQGYYAEIVSADGGSARHYGAFSSMSGYQYMAGIAPELHLLAGTSVKNQGGSNPCAVFGVETDA
tara:strand:- start:259 stop:615 length:357 start_codon:yes stop_codon:yes gene_type:complete